jgi:hypothetical protein
MLPLTAASNVFFRSGLAWLLVLDLFEYAVLFESVLFVLAKPFFDAIPCYPPITENDFVGFVPNNQNEIKLSQNEVSLTLG